MNTEKFYIVDASEHVLGKMAERIAVIIRGKDKVDFDPAKDCGDTVIVINAEKIKLTGKKDFQKKYYSHSRYPGGFKQVRAEKIRAEKPQFMIYHAVKGMLPKTKTRDSKLVKHLKIYEGATHPHEAQKPETLTVNY